VSAAAPDAGTVTAMAKPATDPTPATTPAGAVLFGAVDLPLCGADGCALPPSHDGDHDDGEGWDGT
jgi:hypothetical protein